MQVLVVDDDGPTRKLLTVSVGSGAPSSSDVISTMEEAGTDSDGDGTPDVRELRDGTDPNPGATGEAAALDCALGSEVIGGCRATSAGAGLEDALASALVLALFAIRQRRRKANAARRSAGTARARRGR